MPKHRRGTTRPGKGDEQPHPGRAQRSKLFSTSLLLILQVLGRKQRRIFPEVPPDLPAMGSMVMSIVANLFGLGNAATPFGLQAMKELQKLNVILYNKSLEQKN